jgi:hypothetical protein
VPHPGSHRKRALVALVACLALGPANPAAGQQGTQTPSANELWEDYPLHASPEPARAAPTPTPAEGRRVNAPAAASDAGAGPELGVVAGLVVALGAMTTLWTFRPSRAARRGARKQGGSAPADSGTEAPEPAPEPAAGGRAESPLLKAVELRLAKIPPARPVPGRPDIAWSAEIRWVEAESGARFVALARTGEQEEATVVAESPPLEWPPTGPAAVQALSDAVEELERTLLEAGWTSLPAGTEWYAKRFAWKPVGATPAVPRPAPPPQASAPRPTVDHAPARESEHARTGRFTRDSDWPEGSERMWRCELRWGAGMVSSRFEVVAYGPGERQGRAIGGSATFKWLMWADPDPSGKGYQTELGRLVAALRAAGWEYVGRGPKWYSARFVWRLPAAPPDRIEPRPQLAGLGP